MLGKHRVLGDPQCLRYIYENCIYLVTQTGCARGAGSAWGQWVASEAPTPASVETSVEISTPSWKGGLRIKHIQNYQRATYNLFGKVKFTCLECGRERVVSAWWCRWPSLQPDLVGWRCALCPGNLFWASLAGHEKVWRLAFNMYDGTLLQRVHQHISTLVHFKDHISTSAH